MNRESRARFIEEIRQHDIDRLLHPKVYIYPPLGTIVRVPDGGAEAVTGRVIRYDEDQCVVAKLDDPAYEVWAYVEASDIVKEH